MRRLAIRPRWLIFCALAVIALLSVSVSTGMALGGTTSGHFAGNGFARSGQNSCSQAGFAGKTFGSRMADPTSAIASALNLSPARLQQEISSGESLSQILQSASMTSWQVSDASVAAQQDRLDQQVANGRLTLDQENAMLAAFRAQLDDVLSGKSPLPMQVGQFGGFGRGGGQFNGCGS